MAEQDASSALVTMQKLDPAALRTAFANQAVEAVQVPQPSLDESGYGDIVRSLVASPAFMSDFRQTPVEHALPALCKRVLGERTPKRQVEKVLAALCAIEQLARDFCGPRVLISVRNWFAPGDLVWHVDRSQREQAFRLLWPLGRSAGMWITPRGNIQLDLYASFMRREHPLLCRLDREVVATGQSLEQLWRHRPGQVHAMVHEDFPFIRDRGRIEAVAPSFISVHRIETPSQSGTFHRSAWANRHTPGLQVILTVTSN